MLSERISIYSNRTVNYSIKAASYSNRTVIYCMSQNINHVRLMSTIESKRNNINDENITIRASQTYDYTYVQKHLYRHGEVQHSYIHYNQSNQHNPEKRKSVG